MRRGLSFAAAASLGLLLVSGQVHATRTGGPAAGGPKLFVVDRGVVGGYAENMTYVPNGPFAGQIVLAVGGQAVGVRVNAPDHVAPRVLFDFRAAGPRFWPTGLVYVPDWGRFVANDHAATGAGWPEFLYIFSPGGRVEKWPVERGPGIAPTRYSEGLAYVPAGAADWPADLRGKFLMIAFTTLGQAFPRIDVIEPGNGVFRVVRQIPFPGDPDGNWGSLALLPGGQLLFSVYGRCFFYRADAASFAALAPGEPMTLVREPIASCDPSTGWMGGEGVLALPDGRVASSVEHGTLEFFPAVSPGGTWTPSSTRQVRYGLGLYRPDGIAWDERRGRFLLLDAIGPSVWSNALFEVDGSLRAAAGPVRVLSSLVAVPRERSLRGLTYRRDLDSAVVSRLGRSLMHFPPVYPPEWEDLRTPALIEVPMSDDSAPMVKVGIDAALETITGWNLPVYNKQRWDNGVGSLSFLAGEQAYATRLVRGGPSLHVLAGDGSWIRTMPISVSCAEPDMTFVSWQVAAFPATTFGARFVAAGSCERAPVAGPEDVGVPVLAFLDESGAEVVTFDITGHDMSIPQFLTPITSGRHAGGFAVLDRRYELVILRLR